MKVASLALSFTLLLGSTPARASVTQTALPNVSNLRSLINAELGTDLKPDPIEPPFAAEAPIDENPLTHILHSLFDTARAIVGEDIPKGDTYADHLEKSFNVTVSSVASIVGETIDDGVQGFNSYELESQGFVKNEDVLQCSGDLPLRYVDRLGGILGVSQLKHIWLQAFGTSYGMPYTLAHTYLGGDSMIYSPDEFQPVFADVPDVSCTPVYQPSTVNREDFTSAFKCITDKITHFQGNESSTTIFLDYSLFQHNCLAASRFMVECAGGEIAQDPNLGIGGHFSWDYPVKSAELSPEVAQIHSRFYGVLAELNQAAQNFVRSDTLNSADSDYLKFVQDNAALLEQWRLVTQDWLATKGNQQNQTHFLAKFYGTASDSTQFTKYVTQWGWHGLYEAVDRLESDLTTFDFESGPVTSLSLGTLCNQVRSSCNLPALE